MILFWLLCVSLVIVGLLYQRQVLTALGQWKLHQFGVRLRVLRSQPPARLQGRGGRRVRADRPCPEYWPPPQVFTRPGPLNRNH